MSRAGDTLERVVPRPALFPGPKQTTRNVETLRSTALHGARSSPSLSNSDDAVAGRRSGESAAAQATRCCQDVKMWTVRGRVLSPPSRLASIVG
jgi:hypothetical protein